MFSIYRSTHLGCYIVERDGKTWGYFDTLSAARAAIKSPA
jgi:hypothetical protein